MQVGRGQGGGGQWRRATGLALTACMAALRAAFGAMALKSSE